ncbi:MAG TPA: FHA domain-containing protein [Solirubrobacteraceae bacterium]|nr:FHA domain-containing protein [Solirubrobacteraceae bacterium]
MTIQAQLPDRAPHDSARHEHHTDGMDSSLPFIVDPYALLDTRTRERLMPEAGAPAGRYLSLEHDGETKLIALERPITHIGRGLVADVRLEDAQVSRRHAILAVRGDGARILDDRSYNGTFVNGRRVTVHQLTDGDVIRFGRAVFRFTEIAPPRRAQPLRRIPLARRARHTEPSGPVAA